MKRFLLGCGVGLIILLFLPLDESQDLSWLLKFDRKKEDANILIVSIDEEIEGGRPVSHKRYAECVKALKNKGFRIIGFDLIFSEDRQNDSYFASQIKDAAAYLGLSFLLDSSTTTVDLSSFGIPPSQYDAIKAKGVVTALSPSVLSASNKIGHINLTNEKIVTGIPAAIAYKDLLYPSLALQIAAGFMKADYRIKKDKVLLLKGNKIISTIHLHHGKIPIRFGDFPFCTLDEAISGNIPRGPTIAIIGGKEGDFHTTPMALYPGVSIIANCISNIINKETPVYPSPLFSVVIIIGLCSATLFFKRHLSLCLILLYLFVSVIFFRFGLVLEIWRPIIAVTISLILSFAFQVSCQKRTISLKEVYIERLKKSLRYLQQKVKKEKPQEKPALVASINLQEGFIATSKNKVGLTSYSQKLLAYLLLEQRIHWIDGWLIFDWLNHPPNNDYKAFLVQASKLNKKAKDTGIDEILRPVGNGWYEIANSERIESDLIGIREKIEKAKKLWDKKDEATALVSTVIKSDPNNLEGLRLLAELSGNDEYSQRYSLLIKKEQERLKKVVEMIEKGRYDPYVLERRDEFIKKIAFFSHELSFLASKGIVPKEEDRELGELLEAISELKGADQKEKERILSEMCGAYFFPEILKRQAGTLKREPKDAGLIVIGLLFELLTELDLSRIETYNKLKSYIEKSLKGRIADFLMEESGVSYEERLAARRDRTINDLRDELGREPSVDETCKRLGWSRNKYFEIEKR